MSQILGRRAPPRAARTPAGDPAPGRVHPVSPADEAFLARLDRGAPATRPEHIRAHESWPVRLAMLVAAPVWLTVVALAMLPRLLTRRLPVLVLNERVGFERRPLFVPKIATMSVSSNRRRWLGLIEIARSPSTASSIDGGVDRFLRRTGLDELPQLALVVAGRMRVVGPRPATFQEMHDLLAVDATIELGVDMLHPGIVGVWQVLDRHRYSFEQRCALDIFMLDRWSTRLRRYIVGRSAAQFLQRCAGNGSATTQT